MTTPSESTSANTWAVDVHAHYGDCFRDQFTDLENQFKTGDARTVVERAHRAKTQFTVVSPLSGLFPRGRADAFAGNEEAARVVAEVDGLLQWVIVNPLQPQTYEQAENMLTLPKCVGIKIHPEEHRYPIAEHGDAIFRFAARHRAVVLAHSGDDYSMPMDFVPFADAYPEVRMILAHLGNGGQASGDPDHQVRAIQASKHGNVFTDTSSGRSLLPGLIEWAVGQVGADRILYGTDTPLYFAACQRARIDQADLPEPDKKMILRGNAQKLLALAPVPEK
jgi:predicted TIM-barrel fold metal-dependent hydrolase